MARSEPSNYRREQEEEQKRMTANSNYQVGSFQLLHCDGLNNANQASPLP